MNKHKHPLAGQEVEAQLRIKGGVYGCAVLIEDWWQNVDGGRSWMDAENNPTALRYAMRVATEGLPHDNEVICGKLDGTPILIHASEIGSFVFGPPSRAA
jgi:hypothetical protein